MEKSEVIQKIIFTFRWSENIKFYIFTSENINYTIYFTNIFLYFTTLYIINFNNILKNKYCIDSTMVWLKTELSICADIIRGGPFDDLSQR